MSRAKINNFKFSKSKNVGINHFEANKIFSKKTFASHFRLILEILYFNEFGIFALLRAFTPVEQNLSSNVL